MGILVYIITNIFLLILIALIFYFVNWIKKVSSIKFKLKYTDFSLKLLIDNFNEVFVHASHPLNYEQEVKNLVQKGILYIQDINNYIEAYSKELSPLKNGISGYANFLQKEPRMLAHPDEYKSTPIRITGYVEYTFYGWESPDTAIENFWIQLIPVPCKTEVEKKIWSKASYEFGLSRYICLCSERILNFDQGTHLRITGIPCFCDPDASRVMILIQDYEILPDNQ